MFDRSEQVTIDLIYISNDIKIIKWFSWIEYSAIIIVGWNVYMLS